MDQRQLILIGGGGHAIVVAEAALLIGIQPIGFIDDDANAPLAHGSPAAPCLGRLSDPTAIVNALQSYGQAGWILAFGNLSVRRSIIERLSAFRERSLSIIHPAAILSPSANVGAGVFVGPRAIVHTRAVVRDFAIVNTAAVVEHECDIGENAHVAPGAVLGGRTRVGADSLMGIGSRTLPGAAIGARATIGASSMVLRSVQDGAQVVGVPAKELRRHS